MLEIIVVCGVILFWLIIQSKVTQGYIHLEDDLGFGPQTWNMPRDFMLQWEGQKGWKRVCPDDSVRLMDAVRGRQFPLSLQFAGHQITIVVDFSINGVPGYIRSVRGVEHNKQHAAIDLGHGFFGVRDVGFALDSDLNPSHSMGNVGARQGGGDP